MSHLNSILMLAGCVGKRLTLEVTLRHWPCILVKIPVLASKYPCGVFLRKNGNLCELGD